MPKISTPMITMLTNLNGFPLMIIDKEAAEKQVGTDWKGPAEDISDK